MKTITIELRNADFDAIASQVPDGDVVGAVREYLGARMREAKRGDAETDRLDNVAAAKLALVDARSGLDSAQSSRNERVRVAETDADALTETISIGLTE